jgi:hypothetical protein
MKTYAISKDQIRDIVTDQGDCAASDKITVGARKVALMYRETPEAFRPPGARGDSGWRFFAGDESNAYVADISNFNIFPVNVIANYDPDIVPYLDAPPGSAFRREGDVGAFKKVPFPKPPNPVRQD